MQKQGKVWGQTTAILESGFCALHLIHVHAGGYCSWHRHRYRHNLFLVISGRLEIIEEKSDSGTTDTTTLGAFEWCVAAPNNLHRFSAKEDTVALECYWPADFSSADIVREATGGASPRKATAPKSAPWTPEGYAALTPGEEGSASV